MSAQLDAATLHGCLDLVMLRPVYCEAAVSNSPGISNHSLRSTAAQPGAMNTRNRNSLSTRSLQFALALAGVVAVISALRTSTPLNRQQAASTLDRLLTRLYRSFDEGDEKAIYRRLAESVTGEQINEIYLEHRRALDSEERGGARARVNNVEVLRVRSLKKGASGSLLIDATWTVSGDVDHFGHTHQRRNRYDAIVKIVPVDDGWKIGAIEVADRLREAVKKDE